MFAHPAPLPRPAARRLAAVGIAVLALLSVLFVGVGPAAAHEGLDHLATEAERKNPGTARTSDLAAVETSDSTAEFVGGKGPGRLVATPGRTMGADVDCFVDFDDDLVLQYHVPGGAENTFMYSPWYQKCFDHYYPAIAVKPTLYDHFHLGYEDPKIGPCAGSFTDWGRKADPIPADSDDLGAWVITPCVEDIDPVTEPRSGISPHVAGETARVYAYDGDGKLPFTLRRLQVTSGEVEVCHLPPGPIVVAVPGGSAWQCLTLGQGYWNLTNHVDSAIEVRVEFLEAGTEIDNIGIDLL